jgi:predicted Fe-S protein YdhL (DUF1289 family)
MTFPVPGPMHRTTSLRHMNSISLQEINADTPCTGHCSTALGDDVCRSCLRTFDEITRWVEMNEEERRAVNLRIATLQTTGFRPLPE